MPQIIVMADRASDREHEAVMLRERVSPADFESGHFQAQLVERIGWAVSDADQSEQHVGVPGPGRLEREVPASPAVDGPPPLPAWIT